ncbi:MAG: hypothetical protein AAGK32_17500, partial [Actinomycetota bacterium]
MIASIVVSVALVAAFAVWRRNRRGADGSPGRRSPAAAAIGAVPVLIGWVTLLVLVDAGARPRTPRPGRRRRRWMRS